MFANVWSRHAWLQPMQVLISSARPCAAFATKSGSARNGRAIETRSAPPLARISSATSGVLMRLDAHTGMPTSGRSRAVVAAHAARGTWVRIVGTRASCQPIPVLITEAPAASTACASATVSSQVCPSGTRSSSDIRYITKKSSPRASRIRRTTSTGKRIRFSADPPHRSVRWLVRAARNWLTR